MISLIVARKILCLSFTRPESFMTEKLRGINHHDEIVLKNILCYTYLKKVGTQFSSDFPRNWMKDHARKMIHARSVLLPHEDSWRIFHSSLAWLENQFSNFPSCSAPRWTLAVLGSGIRKSSDSANLCYVSFDSFLYGQIAPKWNLGPVLAFRLYRYAQQLRNMLFSKFIMELVSKLLLMSVLTKMCHF